ncbi:MAG: ABC transporter substrate-binding protein [Methanoregula sp.]
MIHKEINGKKGNNEGRDAGWKRCGVSERFRHAGGFLLLFILLAGLMLLCGCINSSPSPAGSSNSTTITVTDSLGNVIQMPGPASRIVCLNSDATEMLIALGAGNSIVGVTDTTLKNSQLAPLIPNAKNVGTWDAPSLERILSLQPDAVISYSGYRLKNADQFEHAKIPVIYIDCNRLSTLKSDARSMGLITGHQADADRYIVFFDKWFGYTTQKTAGTDLTPVYIEGYSEYMAQGTNSSIDDIVNVARGSNIAAGEGKSYVKVTPEWIIKENPPVIIKVAPDPLPEGKTLGDYREQVMSRPALADVQAVQDGNVYAISGKVVVGPRAPAGLPLIASILHPVQFSGTNPSDALNEYAGEFVPGANATQAISPLSKGS